LLRRQPLVAVERDQPQGLYGERVGKADRDRGEHKTADEQNEPESCADGHAINPVPKIDGIRERLSSAGAVENAA
jgi:hypothetical protein